jgi:autotransporter-associated beta strand protein
MPCPYAHLMRLRAVLGQFVATCAFGLMTSASLLALTVVDYDSEVNDRFSSGFPLNPVPNTSESFIGIEYDWSGVAWSTTTFEASSYKGFGLLSPRHLLVAQHYEHGNQATQGVRILSCSGEVLTNTTMGETVNLEQGIELTPQGRPTAYDLAITRLGAGFSEGDFQRMPVLDMHNSSGSNSLSNYESLSLFHYGRGGSTNASPRVAPATVGLVAQNGSDPKQIFIRTTWSDVKLQGGDSGSPLFHSWTNPNGESELAVLGVNSAVSKEDGEDEFNFVSMLATVGAINAANQVMVVDGFALRVDGNPSRTWAGGSGNSSQQTHLVRSQNWSGGSVPNDLYVLFNGLSTTFLNPVVNNNINLRGLYFRSTESSALGFTFGGSSTLTIGRGGITNYDTSPQVFAAPLALGDHQYWQVGPGGVAVDNLNTNGRLLEVTGAGGLLVSGVISGAGGLAVSDSRVVLQGNNSFTGSTWVHAGELVVNGSIDSAASLQIASPGQVRGSGSLPALNGAGRIAPGVDSQPAILTAHSLQADTELAFDFELRTMQPDYADAANSQNSLLRLTNPTPFASPLSANNKIRFFINRPQIVAEDTFRGGFFTDSEADFSAMLESASIEVYLADAEGDVSFDGIRYSLYNGDYGYRILTKPETADFTSGSVSGRVLVLEFSPEPSTYASWVFETFPPETHTADTEPLADPNGDGIVNLLAYALALDPLANGNSQLIPRFVLESEGGASFQFRRNQNADDLAYAVEASSDLQSWTTLDPAFNIFDPDPDGNGASELLSLDLASAIQSGFQFFRLRIELLNNT